MLKYYKVIRRNVDPLYLPEQVVEGILSSQNQLVKVNEPDGTFRLINKADIVDAYFDRKETERIHTVKKLEEYDSYLDKDLNCIVQVKRNALPPVDGNYEKLN